MGFVSCVLVAGSANLSFRHRTFFEALYRFTILRVRLLVVYRFVRILGEPDYPVKIAD